MENNIIQVGLGYNLICYDREKRVLKVATETPRQKEQVRWWDKGAASYDFHLGEASVIPIADLRGNADIIALLNAVLADVLGEMM